MEGWEGDLSPGAGPTVQSWELRSVQSETDRAAGSFSKLDGGGPSKSQPLPAPDPKGSPRLPACTSTAHDGVSFWAASLLDELFLNSG